MESIKELVNGLGCVAGLGYAWLAVAAVSCNTCKLETRVTRSRT